MSPLFIAILSSLTVYFLWIGISRRAQKKASESAFQQRLRRFQSESKLGDSMMQVDVSNQPEISTWQKIGEELRETIFVTSSGSAFMGMLEEKLIQAGHPRGWHATDFLGFFSVVIGSVVIFGGFLFQAGILPAWFYLFLSVLVIYYPFSFLKSETTKRKEQAFAELPYFLDEIILSLSSGTTTIDKAIKTVVMEDSLSAVRDSQRVLVTEFKRAYTEQAESARNFDEAYRGAAERIQLQEVDDLVDVIVEGYATGAPILKNLQDMSSHIYTVFEQNMATLIKKKDAPFTIATVMIMFGTAVLIAAPILSTVMQALAGGGR